MSLCVRAGCDSSEISFEELARNDGSCDTCAALPPSQFFTARSNDALQQAGLRDLERKWKRSQPKRVRRRKA